MCHTLFVNLIVKLFVIYVKSPICFYSCNEQQLFYYLNYHWKSYIDISQWILSYILWDTTQKWYFPTPPCISKFKRLWKLCRHHLPFHKKVDNMSRKTQSPIFNNKRFQLQPVFQNRKGYKNTLDNISDFIGRYALCREKRISLDLWKWKIYYRKTEIPRLCHIRTIPAKCLENIYPLSS